jgi:aminoglycoside phosphotransferase (APT) family kinase protein
LSNDADVAFNEIMKAIVPLTEQTINDYLLRHVCPYMSFVTERVMGAEQLSSPSGMNTVFRVELETNEGPKTLMLRQARDHAPDGTPMDPARQEFEMKALYHLQTVLPVGMIPIVLAYDSGNHVMTLSDLGFGETLEQRARSGKIPVAAGDHLGRIIATIHGGTRGTGSDFFWSQAVNEALVRFYLSPRLEAARQHSSRRIEELWYQSKTRTHMLLCGNLAPANLLITGRSQIHVINFEQSMIWDPAADLGWFVGMFLSLVHDSSHDSRDAIRFIHRFLEHYLETMIVHGVQATEVSEIEQRATVYAGAALLLNPPDSSIVEVGERWVDQDDTLSLALKRL